MLAVPNYSSTATPELLAIIDPYVLKDELDALWDLFCDPTVVKVRIELLNAKVGHSLRQDVEAIYHASKL